ncbi:hypothetical protein AB4Y32_31895 [Paraburkholderia phymatum]|uniref:Uncharacterized protein n=1 Tax=Paraburkholderia phymatum TaxID=148447 RepID=A0ACC6UA43_9BURK
MRKILRREPRNWSEAASARVYFSDLLMKYVRDNPEVWFNAKGYGDLLAVFLAFAFFFIVALIDGSCIQFLNLSTYQRMYSTRLTRAFLGATNSRRLRDSRKRDVTSLVPGDSISMGEYYSKYNCAPVHLINATINKTIDWDSALVQRGSRGMSISVGPAGVTIGAKLGVLECNWASATDISTPAKHVLRGRETSNIWLESLTLGDWIAISGAAIGTGLGQLTRRGYSLLMGIANIRLGYWWDTYSSPFRQGAEKYPRTRVPLPTARKPQRYITERLFGTQFCLLSELLGRFDGPRARRWNLSDGGHFENTGAYELLRRRLKFILIIDNGADPDYRFDDVANLIRRVRVDFGIEISEVGNTSSGHEQFSLNREVIAGSFNDFKFDKELHGVRLITKFPDGERGQIIVLKPRTSLDAPYDVRRYQGVSKHFPNESTADQFFDDVQWESHRELGYSQARMLLDTS